METFERVHVAAHGRVALIRLSDTAVRNALSADMGRGLLAALNHVEQSGFRAIVLTGEGSAFCSGANLAEAPPDTSGPFDAGTHLEAHYHPLLYRIRNLRMPFLSAVNGAAAGIGMSLALAGDLILAGRSAFFVQAFVHVGLVPDGGATWLLPRLVGLARARELSLLGERLSAETALAWGLVNRVCEDDALVEEALGMAGRLADGPAEALAATRKLFWESPQNGFEAQLALEREAQRRAGLSDDFREGVRAFLEKRTPRFGQ